MKKEMKCQIKLKFYRWNYYKQLQLKYFCLSNCNYGGQGQQGEGRGSQQARAYANNAR